MTVSLERLSLSPVGVNLAYCNSAASLLKSFGLSRWPIRTASTSPSSSPAGTSTALRVNAKVAGTRTLMSLVLVLVPGLVLPGGNPLGLVQLVAELGQPV